MLLTPPTFKGESGVTSVTPRLTSFSSPSSCLSISFTITEKVGNFSLFRCPVVYCNYYGNNCWVDFHSLMFCHSGEIKSSYEYDLISFRNDILR